MAYGEARDFRQSFLEIVPWDTWYKMYDNYGLEGYAFNHTLPLHVVQDKGIEVVPNQEIKITDLNNGYKNFKSNNDDTITFKVDVIIKHNDMWGWGKKGEGYFEKGAVHNWLNYWYQNASPLLLVCDAIEVPNGNYILSSNPKRQQDYTEYVVWTLEFTTLKELQIFRYYNDNELVKSTINALLNPAPAVNTVQTANTQSKTLAQCTPYVDIVYSSTSYVTECNRLLQTKLAQLGYLSWDNIDGWYGPTTANAVKQFQRAWNNAGGSLAVDGDCGPVTLDRLLRW